MVEEAKEVKVMVTGGNDWKIVGKKFFYGWLSAFGSISVPYTINFLQTEDISTLPIWFISLVPVITGVLLAIQNAWVHREKITFVSDN